MTDAEALNGLEALGHADCLRLLSRSSVGRVGFVVSGRPQVLPVNYRADHDGSVVFRTQGRSILTAVDGERVVVEVDGYDERLRTGWSVCVHGTGREITGRDDPVAQRLRDVSVVTWAPGRRDRWFAVVADAVTGRRLPLIAAAADVGWLPGVVG